MSELKISLITSWNIKTVANDQKPLSLEKISDYIDLYLLDHNDIPWYKTLINDPFSEVSIHSHNDPTHFISDLSENDIRNIANELQGKDIIAFATHFPSICDLRLQDLCIKAIRNTILLAALLKCKTVEIVGGSRVVKNDNNKLLIKHSLYKDFVKALYEIYYDGQMQEKCNQLSIKFCDLPTVSIELEPGSAFIMNHPREFIKLLRYCTKPENQHYEVLLQHLMLNIDVAHAMLIGYKPDFIRAMFKIGGIKRTLKEFVGHMHISDHAGDTKRDGMGNIISKTGLHGCDLPPCRFHYENDYIEWIALANELAADPETSFTKVIAIELEACNDIDMVLSAINTVRTWINNLP